MASQPSKTAIVTGGAQGIGLAIAKEVAPYGIRVNASHRRSSRRVF